MAYEMDNTELIDAAARMTPQWFAGFFDGEGCVSSPTSRSGHATINVAVTQSDPRVISLIYNALGGTFSVHKVRGFVSYKVSWQGKTAVPILKLLKDFVVCKRRQVEAAIELGELLGPGGRVEVTQRDHDKRASLSQIIRESNHGIRTKEVTFQ